MKALQNCLLVALTMLFCSGGWAEDCVILLHGLARTENSMDKLAEALEKENYFVVNQGYASTSANIATLVSETLPAAIKKCEQAKNARHIHFVTHSLGGILLRTWLADNELAALKHVVMLGPPNQGSEVVDKLGDVPGFKLINGPAGLELGTEQNSVPQNLGAVNFSLGVIAGTDSVNPILSSLIPGEDDGKVSVARTHIEGMSDHLTLDVTHTFMMRNKQVIEQTLYFLQHGSFQREASEPQR